MTTIYKLKAPKSLAIKQTIQNSNALIGYKYIIFFSMLYMSVMLFNAILTNRYVSLGAGVYVLGGTLTSPLIFILGDIIAEIFGYKVVKQLIWCGFFSQTLFAIASELVIHAPYPPFFKDQNAFSSVFESLLYIDISSFVAFMIGGILNAYAITRWKILLNGRHFWLRSLGASTVSEAVYSLLAILMMELGSIPLENIYKIILISYLIKISYSIVLAGPANILVYFIKKSSKIDIYDISSKESFFQKFFVNKQHVNTA
jgi:uncharacterized integral membrane protein (TIGR00697 family)